MNAYHISRILLAHIRYILLDKAIYVVPLIFESFAFILDLSYLIFKVHKINYLFSFFFAKPKSKLVSKSYFFMTITDFYYFCNQNVIYLSQLLYVWLILHYFHFIINC